MYLTTYFICNFNPHFRKGSDGGQDGYAGSFGKFQSTLPQGKWLKYPLCKRQESCISIHTSAREVTITTPLYTLYLWFQSTLPQGKWQKRLCMMYDASGFQSTLPQGKWLSICAERSGYCNFNPHFRKGSDCNIPQKHLSIFMKYL